jgi:hypothetical protein
LGETHWSTTWPKKNVCNGKIGSAKGLKWKINWPKIWWSSWTQHFLISISETIQRRAMLNGTVKMQNTNFIWKKSSAN